MNDPMKKMNDFFQSRPKRTLLDSIDAYLSQKPLSNNIPTEIVENEHQFIITVEVPGIPKEDIDVEILGEDVCIKIKEQNHNNRTIGGKKYIHIPQHVSKANMKAVYRHGLLEISLMKKKAKKIEIE
ncbi:Hsp20/alpha crystallin family protein [Metabacillus herbersteinensis]|uniref:Hsp20/alpha crystallin family protein n=1 Tax=Metabacillus herbersteinensis TaxID=283816 RepID=A0ABV6GIA2_9BACI